MSEKIRATIESPKERLIRRGSIAVVRRSFSRAILGTSAAGMPREALSADHGSQGGWVTDRSRAEWSR